MVVSLVLQIRQDALSQSLYKIQVSKKMFLTHGSLETCSLIVISSSMILKILIKLMIFQRELCQELVFTTSITQLLLKHKKDMNQSQLGQIQLFQVMTLVVWELDGLFLSSSSLVVLSEPFTNLKETKSRRRSQDLVVDNSHQVFEINKFNLYDDVLIK